MDAQRLTHALYTENRARWARSVREARRLGRPLPAPPPVPSTLRAADRRRRLTAGLAAGVVSGLVGGLLVGLAVGSAPWVSAASRDGVPLVARAGRARSGLRW